MGRGKLLYGESEQNPKAVKCVDSPIIHVRLNTSFVDLKQVSV
jgi:hypothetical protein